MYEIDFLKLINQLLPSFLRKAKMRAWLEVVLAPLQNRYNAFLSHREEVIFDVSVTGQVRSLEFMLNKIFYEDGHILKIYISDASRNPQVYLFQNTETHEPVYLYNTNEQYDGLYVFNTYDSPGSDFTVWVPDSLLFDLNYMRALIDRHKAAGFKYSIKYYTEIQNPT